jgi:hypothetical protein
MAAMDQAVAKVKGTPPTSSTLCPYHWDLLKFGFDGRGRTPEQVLAMNQYLVEAAANQTSMILGEDGKLSTHKDCTCWMVADGWQA